MLSHPSDSVYPQKLQQYFAVGTQDWGFSSQTNHADWFSKMCPSWLSIL